MRHHTFRFPRSQAYDDPTVITLPALSVSYHGRNIEIKARRIFFPQAANLGDNRIVIHSQSLNISCGVQMAGGS
jgi:hypothetical protein